MRRNSITPFCASFASLEWVHTFMPSVTGVAHAAVRRDGELLVIAEVRHIDAELVGGVHHGRAVRDLDFRAVDDELRHLGRFLKGLDVHPASAPSGFYVFFNQTSFLFYVVHE